MKKILIRADDLGYSEGVNYGILKSVKDGLVRSIGVMPNMDATDHGVELLKGYDVCFGQHTNFCVGKPLSDPARIPSLVDENGFLKSSKTYRSAKEDFVVFEEAVIEIEAQHRRFVELFGFEPGYFEGHAVASENFFKALEFVADKYGLKYSGLSFGEKAMRVGNSDVYMHMGSMDPEYEPNAYLQNMVLNDMHEGCVDVLVCHPGYLDAYIMNNSSLLKPRAMEVEMLCRAESRKLLEDNSIIQVSYKDL
ncbi:MAG: ChbG/HpnK family deacetylase [Erysipelotrichaceae bacterium]|nr:ChbG/HpnK family deacetylase [Erysipelotrichaceae bacterium]MCR5095670.1 ChbG/HpnK family deacetylase [Erysipelotrichaceae bacterium]